MNTITITLTAYNMGPQTTTEDFDAWHSYVIKNVAGALGLEQREIDRVWQFAFDVGATEDRVDGGTEEQREAIRSWLAHEGWDAFCGERGAAPAPETYIVLENRDATGGLIDPTVMPADTADQLADAAQELRARGVTSADVWTGAQPDAVRTSRVVLAAP